MSFLRLRAIRAPLSVLLAAPLLAAVAPLPAAARAPGGPSCAHLHRALGIAPDLAHYAGVRQRASQCGFPVSPTSGSPTCAHLAAAARVAPALRQYPGVAARLVGCLSAAARAASRQRAAAAAFVDLAGFSWAVADINLLAGLGILQGTGAHRFDPRGHLTRAQFAALMMRLFYLPQPPLPVAFVDVPSTFWAYRDIEAASPYMSSFTTPGGTAFEPRLPTTRVEVAATIGRIEVVEGLAQLPSQSQAQSLWNQFRDGAQVPPGLAQYGAVALETDLMKGYPGGSFGVEDPLTRAEAAVLLARVLRRTETQQTTPVAPPPPGGGAPALGVITSSLPPATAGAAYTAVLAASGGVAPYAWSAAGPLPDGLALAPDGTLSGTPQQAGTVSLEVEVTDSSAPPHTATATVTLAVDPVLPATLTVIPAPLPAGTAGVPYSGQLQAAGGTPPYTWSASGDVPPGLGVDTVTGAVYGTPQAAGDYSFTAGVADNSVPPGSAGATVSIAVASGS